MKRKFTILALSVLTVLLSVSVALALSPRQEEVINARWYFEQGFDAKAPGLVSPVITDSFTATGLVKNADLTDDTIKQGKLNRRFTYEEFESNPITAGIAGGAATGTAGDENVMIFEENIFEYHIVGTQTILAPVLTATGLNIALDLTENDGVEITQGITARSRSAFVVGTDACYFKATVYVTDVSGTDALAVGFRTAEAYNGDEQAYNNMAALSVVSGDVYIWTIDDNAATTATDTTDNLADTNAITIAVYVSDAGVVTYTIDGSAPTTTAAFTWDDGDTIVPFIYLRHDANVAEATLLQLWECGLQ